MAVPAGTDKHAPSVRLRLAHTAEQPKACSISRSFTAAPLQHTLQMRGRGGKHSPPECRQAETHTHRESASASHTVSKLAAASLPYQTEHHGGSVAALILAGGWSRRQALSTRVPAGRDEMSTHRESACASHHL